MTLQEAISNLKIHQQWRLGADIVMIEPKELTESIDIVLSQLPQQEISKDGYNKELEELINKHSMENESNTADFILACFLSDCLKSFNNAVNNREQLKKKL